MRPKKIKCEKIKIRNKMYFIISQREKMLINKIEWLIARNIYENKLISPLTLATSMNSEMPDKCFNLSSIKYL